MAIPKKQTTLPTLEFLQLSFGASKMQRNRPPSRCLSPISHPGRHTPGSSAIPPVSPPPTMFKESPKSFIACCMVKVDHQGGAPVRCGEITLDLDSSFPEWWRISTPQIDNPVGAITEFQDTMITWSESKPHHLERTWSTLTFPLRVGYISISFIHLNFSFFWDLNHNFYFEEMASPNGRCHPKPNNHVLRVHSKSFISFRPPETSWNFKKSKKVRASVFLVDIKSWSHWSQFKLHHRHPTPTPPKKKQVLSHLTDNRRFPTTPSLRPRNLLGTCHHFLGRRSFGPFKTLQNFHHLWHTPKLNEKIPKRGLLLGGTPIESQTTGPPNHQFNHQLTPIKLWTLTKSFTLEFWTTQTRDSRNIGAGNIILGTSILVKHSGGVCTLQQTNISHQSVKRNIIFKSGRY